MDCNTLSLGSTESSNNTTSQIGKMVPRCKFKGKELLYEKQVEEHKREIKNKKKTRTMKKSKKVSTYCKEQGC
jgi:hypothetical protein